MADYVSAANAALSLLGEDDQLRDPNEDSHAARSVRAVWDIVRKAVLRDHPWNFAIKRIDLAAVPNVVTYPRQSAFRRPDGFLRLLEVLDPACARDRFNNEGAYILADTAGPLWIRYVGDVPDPGNWDDLFVAAFAARLAFQIADRITGDRGRKADAWSTYEAALASAKGVDAKEDPPVVPEESDWVTARYC